MQYDPIKNTFMNLIKRFPWLRKVFFLLLDLLFLRQWYVKKNIRKFTNVNSEFRFYDAGSGFCQYSDYILHRYSKSSVFALDLKEDYLKEYAGYAVQNFPDRFFWICADLVEYVPAQKFNLIAAIDILEHIENDIKVMQNFYHCLDDGGKLIISTPSNLDETAKFTAEHVRPGYSKQEIIDKLQVAGFKISSFSYSYGKWGKLSWKLAIKYPLLLLSYSKLMLLALPIYYICLYPFIYLLMLLDINMHNRQGNGISVVAEKPTNAS